MYQPTKPEKIARGIMLGCIPVTLLLFSNVILIMGFARGVNPKGGMEELFFPGREAIFFCTLFVVYIAAAIFGYFKGWEGYTKIYSFFAKWLDITGGIQVDSGARVLTPKDRVRKMHHKQGQ
ncbi:hypothetical protein [Microbulbifer sp. TRSA007]|uniref:hypothetical protein n=1 Tax=Microbulbifer sp. TRSA007 TaxID=3243384 RepID=UPI0040390C49